MKNYTDVTSEYLEKARPGEGKVSYKAGYACERHDTLGAEAVEMI